MKIAPLNQSESSGANRPGMRAILAAALVALVAIAYCLSVIVPLGRGILLFTITVWFSLPGVAAAWLMYAPSRGRAVASWIVGPIWGYGISSLVLLALWTSGVRGEILFAAPIAAFALAVVAGLALRGALEPPIFGKADIVVVLLLLVMVPAIVGRPFAHVAEPVNGGRAYRAYFTADMIWRMAVVAEVSKGSIPPRNPFLRGQALNYYWLPHLLPAVQYRELARQVSLEQVLLVNSVALGLAFVAFLYGFVRQWVSSRAGAALGTIAAFVFTSFEGTERLFVLWMRGESFHSALLNLKDLNIDAVTRWFYYSLPIDGLQRLLWYQPHHSTGYALGLSCLLVLVQTRRMISARVLGYCGVLLAVTLLFSTFAAIMLTMMVAATAGVMLLRERQWTTLVTGTLAGAVPLAIAVWIATRLRYADLSGPSLARVLVNPMAVTNFWPSMFLNFGPMLIFGAVGAVLAIRRRVGAFLGVAAIVIVSLLFYFFVDVRDHQYVYVGWRSGHFLFVALAALTGYGLQELWRVGRRTRIATAAAAIVLALAALPTFAIDFYNTQDITNYRPDDRNSWTLVLSADEVAALDWIRTWTPPDAIVQIEPHARDGRRWADVPAFAERRMAAGLPISMVPLKRYEDASRTIEALYKEADAEAAYRQAAHLGIDYLIVGPFERASFPQFEATLRSRPSRFREAFRSGDVSVFMLEGGS